MKKLLCIALLITVLLEVLLPIARVLADSNITNSYCIQLPCAYYDPNSTGTNCNSADVSLTGSDNEEKAYNFFRAQGLDDLHTAAIIGNLMLESGLNPEAVEGGGNSKTQPTNILAGTSPPHSPGWGIAQWTLPYQDVSKLAQDHNISGALYELSTQLNLLWAQLNSKGADGKSIIDGLNQQSDLASAVDYFLNNFERGATSPARLTFAQDALGKYGGGSVSTGGAVSTTTGSVCSATGSVNCTGATGNAKILCEAEAYTGIYYRWGGGHQGYSNFVAGCPDPSNPPNNQPTGSPPDPTDGNLSGNPSPCATDCSGLIDIAVQAAFGTDLNGAAVQGLETDTTNWKEISIESVQPGDIVVRTTEHVEIVDHYDPSTKTLYTFGSHETGTQTSKVSTSLSDWTGAYSYVGPQSSGGQ